MRKTSFFKSFDDNPWDDKSVPELKLDGQILRYHKGQSANAQKVITNMIKKASTPLDLKVHLKRAKQLAYIEPWFQSFLPPNLKNRLFVYSIGRHFWLIGAESAMIANRFNYCQQEIQKSLEAHLNKISHQTWEIPPFRVRTVPKTQDDRVHAIKPLPHSVPMRETMSVAIEKPSSRLELLIKRLDERCYVAHKE